MIHGIILSVICIVIMPKFLGRFTGDQEVIRYGVRYASVAFLFSPIIMAGLAFEKIFQAVGRMKVSMIALLGGCITNIILDPILIFDWHSFRKWESPARQLPQVWGSLSRSQSTLPFISEVRFR